MNALIETERKRSAVLWLWTMEFFSCWKAIKHLNPIEEISSLIAEVIPRQRLHESVYGGTTSEHCNQGLHFFRKAK